MNNTRLVRSVKLIMKQQPVATELRLISAALKMVTDMERVGRQSIASVSFIIEMLNWGGYPPFPELISMGRSAEDMVAEAIQVYSNKDLDLALANIKKDDVVDGYHAYYCNFWKNRY